MGRKSRNKGAVGEREFAEFLSNLLGIEIRRGIQYRDGGKEAGDVVGLDGVHVEVKRTETLHLWKALDQARSDAPGQAVPIVAHRPNRKPWLLIFEADRLIDLARVVVELTEEKKTAPKPAKIKSESPKQYWMSQGVLFPTEDLKATCGVSKAKAKKNPADDIPW